MIKSKDDLKLYLACDRQALGLKSRGFIKELLATNPILRFQTTLRHLEYYTNVPTFSHRILKLITRFRFRQQSLKLGFSIPVNVFGPGLSIAHYGTIVVSQYARIGAFCRIHACVNIGASGGGNDAPIIGENCYIGPGAILFGGITLADNITIGANSTVNKSFFEENIVIAGTPAKIVKTNTFNWLSFNNMGLTGGFPDIKNNSENISII